MFQRLTNGQTIARVRDPNEVLVSIATRVNFES
jgi:hypothetical protein